ncbi:MAG: hypothetical protein WBK20_04460 [Spirochaetota bacterium]
MDKRKNTIILKKKINEIPDDDFVDGTPAQRIAMVWEITRDTWAFLGGSDAEQRLQRHVTNIVRRRC